MAKMDCGGALGWAACRWSRATRSSGRSPMGTRSGASANVAFAVPAINGSVIQELAAGPRDQAERPANRVVPMRDVKRPRQLYHVAKLREFWRQSAGRETRIVTIAPRRCAIGLKEEQLAIVGCELSMVTTI